MNKEVKELLNKCDNCNLKECICCEFTYTDIQEIKKYIKELEQKESILDKVTDSLDKLDKILKQDGIFHYDVEIRKILDIIEEEKK